MPFLDPTLPYPGPSPEIPVYEPPPVGSPASAPLPIPTVTGPVAGPSGPLPPEGGWTPDVLGTTSTTGLPASTGTAAAPTGGWGSTDPIVPQPGSPTPPAIPNRPVSTTPGVPRGGFQPPPRPVPIGSGGETAAASATGSTTPGLQGLGAPAPMVQAQDPRSVLESLYRDRNIDPDSPTGPLASLGNVDYYVGRVQDTGGWQGGNVDYWKNRLAQDLDLGQTGLGARPAQNQALIDAGLGNQPGAYAAAAPPPDERMARTRGRLLDLLRPGGGRADAVRQNPASQILESAGEREARYAQQAQGPREIPQGVGLGGPLSGAGLAARRVQLQDAVRQALARGDAQTARAAQQALRQIAGRDVRLNRQTLLATLGGGGLGG